MDSDLVWSNRFSRDIQFGYVGSPTEGPGQYNPRLVLNQDGRTVEHALVEELQRGGDFTFSVAFISAGAIAQLKQHLRDHMGSGRGRTDFSDRRTAEADLVRTNALRDAQEAEGAGVRLVLP
jgi:hypothetical protein